jgi:hypothetical protein
LQERACPRTRYLSRNPRHRHTAFAGKRVLHRFGVSRHFRVNPKCASADISQARRQTCRSRLAGEPGVSVQTHGTDTPPSRASALLHRFGVSRHFRVNPKCASADISQARRQTCRSRLAGERGISAEIPGTDPSPSRASALLQWFCMSSRHRCSRHSFNPTGQVSLSLYPSGHGSLGSSMCWCVPVIHARPDRLGMIALRPATSVSLWILQ